MKEKEAINKANLNAPGIFLYRIGGLLLRIDKISGRVYTCVVPWHPVVILFIVVTVPIHLVIHGLKELPCLKSELKQYLSAWSERNNPDWEKVEK